MKFYHALKASKLEEIHRAGKITSPIRCYETIDQATQWAKLLGLTMIIEINDYEAYNAGRLMHGVVGYRQNNVETFYIEEDVTSFKIVKVIPRNTKE